MELIKRVNRVSSHVVSPWKISSDHVPYRNILIWTIDWLYIILDLFFFDKIVSVFLSIFLTKKPLTPEQVAIGKSMFGDSIDYDLVRIHLNVNSKMSRFAYAYVVFNVINFNRVIRADILIHEYVHVWQYQRFGSVYIFRALLAQCSKEGYDYGGMESLYNGMLTGKKLMDFNFEQQGDIVQHAYLQKKGIRGVDNSMYSSVYTYYTNQLLE